MYTYKVPSNFAFLQVVSEWSSKFEIAPNHWKWQGRNYRKKTKTMTLICNDYLMKTYENSVRVCVWLVHFLEVYLCWTLIQTWVVSIHDSAWQPAIRCLVTQQVTMLNVGVWWQFVGLQIVFLLEDLIGEGSTMLQKCWSWWLKNCEPCTDEVSFPWTCRSWFFDGMQWLR